MALDRDKWRIRKAIPKAEKPDLELQSDRMIEVNTKCCVCGTELALQGHSMFREVYDSGHDAKGPERGEKETWAGCESVIQSMIKNTACEWCYAAKRDYEASKEAISKVVAWLGRNYDPSKKEFRCPVEQQERMGKILHSWTKKWSDALRRMKNSPNLVWSQDIGRIIWTRPRAAFTFLAKMEDQLYDPSMTVNQQIGQIKNLLRWMQGREMETV